MADRARLDPPSTATTRPLRVAVVGAGPAGLFVADALTDSTDVSVCVEVIDQIPTPFGLLRYGVAPDHPAIRSIRNRFTALLHRDDVAFLGGVEIGRDVTVQDLREHVDAIIYSYGSASDRHLDVPGEHLLGSLSATEFVAWYCGHPDADHAIVEDALSAGGSEQGVRSAVVIGAGNVALDVARVLARTPDELVGTDMPDHVLAALATTTPQEVHLLARRGPADVAFSTPELRELAQLSDATVVLADPDVDLADRPGASRTAVRNLAVLRDWAQTEPPPPGRRRVVLHFWSRTVQLVGAGPSERERVQSVLAEPTGMDSDGRLVAIGPPYDIPADLVLRAVGYRGVRLPGVPFDEMGAVVPNEAGRVLGIGGRPGATGEYVTGWAKRGPHGVIGTNKPDARETAKAVLADAPELLRRPDPGGLAAWLSACRTPSVDIGGWDRIDAAEIALGQTEGRDRTTLADRAAMLAAADHDPDDEQAHPGDVSPG